MSEQANFRRASALGVTSGLVLALGGCIDRQPHDAAPPQPAPLEASQAPEADVATLPDTLPPAVAAQVDNAALVFPGVAIARSQSVPLEYGSGVRVSADQYLTAGHLFFDKSHELTHDCGPTQIQVMTKEPLSTKQTAGGLSSYKTRGIRMDAPRKIGSFSTKHTAPDITLLRAPNAAKFVDSTASVTVSKTDVAVGESVFFINYQPTELGDRRFPYSGDLGGDPFAQAYGRPAIYGGLVLSKTNADEYVVATNIQSYGAITDTRSRGGASGGPVFTAAGKLIGIHVAGSEPQSIETISRTMDVKLTGAASDKKIATSFVQRVTPHMLADLTRKLTRANICGTPAGTN